MKYRKKPVVIEAVQLRWDNWDEMCAHAQVGKLADGKPSGCFVDSQGQGNLRDVDGRHEIGLWIPTLEGLMLARENDYVIRGIAGELYSCKLAIFEATYERVE